MILTILLQGATEAVEGISGGALAFMLTCMAAVTALMIWCFKQVLSTPMQFDRDDESAPGGRQSS